MFLKRRNVPEANTNKQYSKQKNYNYYKNTIAIIREENNFFKYNRIQTEDLQKMALMCYIKKITESLRPKASAFEM